MAVVICDTLASPPNPQYASALLLWQVSQKIGLPPRAEFSSLVQGENFFAIAAWNTVLPANLSSCLRSALSRHCCSPVLSAIQPPVGCAAVPELLAWQTWQFISVDTGSTELELAICLPVASLAVTRTIGYGLKVP